MRYRFKAVAARSLAAGDQLTGASFLDMFCVATGAAAAYQLANYFRVRKIEIWGPMASDLAPVTVSVEWNGTTAGAYGKSVVVTDTSMGSSEPAHVVARPPPGSQVAMWLGSGSPLIAKLSYPANSIVDVSFDAVFRDEGTAVSVTGAVAGATTGALYVRALNSPVDNNLVPVGVATI